jgi:hypothetical protein
MHSPLTTYDLDKLGLAKCNKGAPSSGDRQFIHLCGLNTIALAAAHTFQDSMTDCIEGSVGM